MGRHEHRGPERVDVAQQLEHAARRLLVEVACGLVGEEHERLYRLRKECEAGLADRELSERKDELENAILAERVTFKGEEMPLRTAQAKLAVLPAYRDREELGTLQGDASYVVPTLVVLVILAVPPILSGVYAGVEGVDPAARDAARGMGMKGTQVLARVEVPCALPLIFSGLRSAMLQIIATATIAAVAGLGGLGRFLIDGQATRNYDEMAGGALVVAALALVVDLVFGLIQRAVTSPGVTAQSTGRL